VATEEEYKLNIGFMKQKLHHLQNWLHQEVRINFEVLTCCGVIPSLRTKSRGDKWWGQGSHSAMSPTMPHVHNLLFLWSLCMAHLLHIKLPGNITSFQSLPSPYAHDFLPCRPQNEGLRSGEKDIHGPRKPHTALGSYHLLTAHAH
jgi:hypothetical protein